MFQSLVMVVVLKKNLEKANIILNRQLLPGDIKAGRHYMHPSGIRIGVPETTRLGMKESEMKEIANFIKGMLLISRILL